MLLPSRLPSSAELQKIMKDRTLKDLISADKAALLQSLHPYFAALLLAGGMFLGMNHLLEQIQLLVDSRIVDIVQAITTANGGAQLTQGE